MAANFFEQQAQARSATNRLVLLYILAVLSIVAAVTLAFHFIFLADAIRVTGTYADPSRPVPLHYDLTVALAVLVIIGIGTLVRTFQVGSDGENVARMLGGVPVSPDTKDLLERRLMNVVEEMSIASGVPVPRVFVLPDEKGINAFAAGLRPGHAVVAVTRGTLEQLTRDELQGVIAHEFSHIFNGDMRLNLRLMGVLGGILALATIGRLLFRGSPSRTSSNRKGNVNVILFLGLALFIIGYIGVFFARLIKAAVSRQREYLADASAVQFTRNPTGIGGALMKIRGYAPSSKIQSHYAEEASHLFFGSALNFTSMFATHPPLEDRIARVDPSLLMDGGWDAKPALDAAEAKAAGLSPAAAGLNATAAFAGEVSNPLEPSASLAKSSSTSPSPSQKVDDASSPLTSSSATRSVLASVGAPSAGDVEAARAFLDSLPPSIRERTRDREAAVLLVVALFIESQEIQPEQLKVLTSSLTANEVQKVVTIRRELASIGEVDRLSLLELSIPPLRQLTADSKKMLLKIGTELVNADDDLDLYEYVALALLEHQLLRDLRARKPRPVLTSQRTAGDLALLLSAIAYAGADDMTAAKRAFDAGVTVLQQSMNTIVALRPLGECTLSDIVKAIERLSFLDPDSQRKVIQACVEAILVDGHVNAKEAQLLRGLCAVLEAPLPALAV